MTSEIPNDRLTIALRELRLAALPDDLRDRLVSIAHASMAQGARVVRPSFASTLRTIVANLVHDSFGQTAVAGARSASLVARDIVHRWDNNDLVLTIPTPLASEEDESRIIQGQIFGPNEARWNVMVHVDGLEHPTAASMDEDGLFAFSAAAYSTFAVLLTDDEVAVQCGPISLDPMP